MAKSIPIWRSEVVWVRRVEGGGGLVGGIGLDGGGGGRGERRRRLGQEQQLLPEIKEVE